METLAVVLSLLAIVISVGVVAFSAGRREYTPTQPPPIRPGVERVYYLKGQWENPGDFGPGAILRTADPHAEVGFIEVDAQT